MIENATEFIIDQLVASVYLRVRSVESSLFSNGKQV